MSYPPEDFPPLWQRPGFQDLIDCLRKLRVDPPVWNIKISHTEIFREQDTTVQQRREIASYLSSVISSNLGWIEDEDQREEIWTAASKRLSERCGRAAMGEITRRWPFEAEGNRPAFELIIREPPLTGDSLGLKTWGSSYVLAHLLPRFAATSLSHLLSSGAAAVPAVLELGSGTGLLGLAAACMWRARVLLTDLPDIVPNLTHNLALNLPAAQCAGGDLEACPLTWGGNKEDSDARFQIPNQFKIVLAADPLYDDHQPELLAGAIDSQLALEGDSRALVMIPLRDETTKRLMSLFVDDMSNKQHQLICIEESVVPGQDDWGDDDESRQIACWWGIFGRQSPTTLDGRPCSLGLELPASIPSDKETASGRLH